MTRKRIIFVCVENSNRSQMAEAFAHIHGGDRVEAFSAGSRPSGRVNPRAVAAMQEVGYDLTTHTSKGLDEFNGQPFDAAVTMGCGDECPLVLAKQRMELPWVAVEKDYTFDAEEGKKTLVDLFDGRSQLLIYHLPGR